MEKSQIILEGSTKEFLVKLINKEYYKTSNIEELKQIEKLKKLLGAESELWLYSNFKGE